MQSSTPRVTELIDRLGLIPHPEGGWYRQNYASVGSIPESQLPDYEGPRHCATSIYFLLDRTNFSAFHRLKSEELWFHHAGDPLDIHVIHPDRRLETMRIGPIGADSSGNFEPQALVPGNTWFASAVSEGGSWSLVGCVVTPGFDVRDFELANRHQLVLEYPEYRGMIESFTRLHRKEN